MRARTLTNLVSIAVILAPWCLGGILEICNLLVGLIGWLCLLVLVFCSPEPGEPHEPRLSCLVLGLLFSPFLIGTIQLIPLPASVVEYLSPAAAELRSIASASSQEFEVYQPLSLVPWATLRDLSKYWIAVCYVTIGICAFRDRQQVWQLLSCTFANGVVLAIFSILQKYSWNGNVLWFIPSRHVAGLGPFINKNNGAGYLCLVLACGCAILVRYLEQQYGLTRESPTSGFSWRDVSRWIFADPILSALLGGLGILWLGILVSRSRGACVAAVTASLLAAMMVRSFRSGPMRKLLIISVVVAVGLTVWSRQSSTVAERLASIVDGQQFASVKVVHWRDDWNLAGRFATTGSGIGTYRFVNRPFQSFHNNRVFLFSENQYLESLLVGGLPGLTVLLLLLGVTAAKIWRLRNTAHHEVLVLILFGFTSQVVAACFDFGLYHVPNFMLLALLVGIAWGYPTGDSSRPIHHPRRARRTGIAATVLVTGVLALAVLAGNAAIELAMGGDYNRLPADHYGVDSGHADLNRRIASLQTLLDWYPNHPFGQARLADLYTLRFRRRAMATLKSSLPQVDDLDRLWELTDLSYLASRMQAVDGTSLPSDTSDSEFRDLFRAAACLQQARACCPYIPELHTWTAPVEAVVRGQSSEHSMAHLAVATRIAPKSSSIQFQSGLIATILGERDHGLRWVRNASELQPEMSLTIVNFARAFLTPAEFANQLVPQDPALSLQVANRFFKSPEDGPWVTAIANQMLEVLSRGEQVQEPAATSYYRARAHQIAGRLETAVTHYSEAIRLQPAASEWRYELADLLATLGRYEEATREATVCLRQHPNDERLKRLLRRLEKERLAARQNPTAEQ